MIFGSAHSEFESVIFKAIRDKIRNGKIKLLKTYIQLIGGIRLVAIGAAGLCAIVAVFIAGCTLLGVGLLALLPISTEAFFIVLASVGGAMMVLSGGILLGFFAQRNWIKHAKVSELMEMVLEDSKNEKSLRDIFEIDRMMDRQSAAHSKGPSPVRQL